LNRHGVALVSTPFRKLFEGFELSIEFGYGLLQHQAMTRVAGGLELPGQAFTGEKQAMAFAVAFLLGSGKRRVRRFPALGHFFLLLLY
jgi:hypothetical protein